MCTLCQALDPQTDFVFHDEVASSPEGSLSQASITPMSATFTEVSDAPANTSTTYALGDDDVFSGSVDSTGDVDWIAVTLADGAHLTVVQDNVSLGAYNTLLALYDSTSTQIAGELYYDTDESTLSYYNTTGSTQTVYIAASSFSGGTGDYTITAQIQEYGTGTIDEIVEYLTTGWIGTEMAWNVATGGTIYVDITDLDADEAALALDALDAWTYVSGLNFVTEDFSVTGNTGITFVNDYNGDDTVFVAQAGPQAGGLADNVISDALVTITSAWVDFYGTGYDDYSFLTYMHEIGHALGLTHGGPYNGTATYSTTPGGDNIFDNDSYLMTIMSYFGLDEATALATDVWLPVTPMLADILAIQELYGVAGTLHTGDTTYGYNSTAGGYYDDLTLLTGPFALTLIDDGGTDTLDLSGMTSSNTVDLTPGAVSSVGGLTNNLVIFDTTIIEHLILGSGSDTVLGNAANNSIFGGGSVDVIDGGAGNDTIEGGAGGDYLVGGVGANTLTGDLDYDTLSYETSSAGVIVSLLSGSASGGDASGDTFSGFEGLRGSAHNDELIGDGADNTLHGLAGDDYINAANGDDSVEGGDGDDIIIGGAGADILSGGANTGAGDTVSYVNSNAAVQVDNSVDYGSTSGGHAAGDVLDGFENIIGSAYGDELTGRANGTVDGYSGDDTLFGSTGDDYVRGGQGNDTMLGSAGADSLLGGTGVDLVDYSNSNAAVTVGINNGGTIDGGYATNDYLEVENITGSAYADDLTGNTLANVLNGLAQDDTFNGSSGNDIINGGSGNDYMLGSRGADTIDGGTGIDTAAYTNSDARVVVDLDAGTATGSGHGSGDTLILIENVVGSNFNDDIWGDEFANTIDGGIGVDELFGRDGDDVLNGGGGYDYLSGGAGNDTLSGNGGTDEFLFDLTAFGQDTITDFTNGLDRLDMRGSGLVYSDLTITQVGADKVITVNGATDSITLLGVTTNIDAADFIF